VDKQSVDLASSFGLGGIVIKLLFSRVKNETLLGADGSHL
jgi:hypothetical protein